MEPQKEQIAPEIIQAIVAQATASGLTVNDYLARLLGLKNGNHERSELQAAPEATLDEFMQAMESIAEDDIQPLPADFSREEIYLPRD